MLPRTSPAREGATTTSDALPTPVRCSSNKRREAFATDHHTSRDAQSRDADGDPSQQRARPVAPGASCLRGAPVGDRDNEKRGDANDVIKSELSDLGPSLPVRPCDQRGCHEQRAAVGRSASVARTPRTNPDRRREEASGILGVRPKRRRRQVRTPIHMSSPPALSSTVCPSTLGVRQGWIHEHSMRAGAPARDRQWCRSAVIDRCAPLLCCHGRLGSP